MSFTSSIVRQFVVSTVLLTIIQDSSAVRFSRSMRYAAPSLRRYTRMNPWKYVPFGALPKGMQRRFMWKEMDDTVDELMDGVASGARAMTHIFTPPMVRYRKPIEFDTQQSAKIKYVIKKPPPPFKHMKAMKFRAPKKPIHMYSAPLVAIPSAGPLMQLPKPNIIVPYMSEEELRKIEKEQEKRVENGNDDHDIHEHSHQTHMDPDVVSGRINEFGEGWLPIQAPFSTPKPFAVSKLHTKVDVTTTATAPPATITYPTLIDMHSYEVTEHSAEESVQKEQAFKPSNHFDFLGPTTELPNYPEYFLRTVQRSEEEFKPRRVHTVAPTTQAITSTTSITTTLSHRLPARSTTERPFKRYNLHRPKSSKLFFTRPTSEPAKLVQPTTTTEQSVRVLPEQLLVLQEPIKTTRETVKTTREPVRTTRESPKAPPEKVRTTRNDSEVKSKIRIKNVSQNESLNKVLNKHRGAVKFGEKKS